jgi:hypothetical protein
MEPVIVPITLEQVYRAVLDVKTATLSIDERLKVLNGTVRQHCEDIAVLKDWRASQANEAIHQVGDLRVELARVAVMAGGFGAAATIIAAVLKAFGVF